MNLGLQKYALSSYNKNKIYILNKFINKKKEIFEQNNNTDEKNLNNITNSYINNYSERKLINNNSKTYRRNNKSNSYNIRNEKDKSINFFRNLNLKYNPNSLNSNINNILRPPIQRGMYSYRQTIKKDYVQKFVNSNTNYNNQKQIEEKNDNKNINNINNIQINNVSNIKPKINSSIHHINSSSSLNTSDIIRCDNESLRKNNLRHLLLKNKIFKENKNKLNYGDEEQENKNICVNKSTKSTKSRSVDLNKYLIKPFNDNFKNNNENININKKNSISSIYKKNNHMESTSFEEGFSNPESLQFYKFKSNEFDDFTNYNIKSINNENNINNYLNEDNNDNMNDEYKNIYRKENRRLIVEYLKIIKIKYQNISIEELCRNNNISQLILNLPKKQILSNSFIQTKNYNFNYYEEYKNIIKNNEKIEFINFLSTPRIMFLINETNEKMPYIFCLSPNICSYNDGIEGYTFKWTNIKDLSDKNYYDLFHLKKCNINNKDNKKFDITFEEHDCIEENENYSSTFIVDALSSELASNYVNGLNYLIDKKNNI